MRRPAFGLPSIRSEHGTAMTTTIVVTTISSPNAALERIADGAKQRGIEFIVIGDTKSPKDFALPTCRFLDIEAQLATGLRYAAACPVRSYARKNVGYLLAMAEGADIIIETDDDNFPRSAFFEDRTRRLAATVAAQPGWLNIYRYFSDVKIWPRGLPLDVVSAPLPSFDRFQVLEVDCPIQQGLADENPDVDAIYRLLLPLPQNFRNDRHIALGKGTWCPFNSQNTTWWAAAFPLLYLPAHCSFRMTDIWRGFVAQRIAWESGWHILYHEPTVWQERNDHDLMRDFADEVPGYLNNNRIRTALEDTAVLGGPQNLLLDLRRCYETLIRIEVVGSAELGLIETWTADLEAIGQNRQS
jgi:hypothetical protein